jgi:diadenosine tetraphosphate (Ap4A) HIT family hydrolase
MDIANQSTCPFCIPDKSRIILANDHAMAFHDSHPVTPGHTLIVPKRHIVSFFEATREEQGALFDLLADMRQLLLNSSQPFRPASWVPFDKEGSLSAPDGFNIGINDGAAAGQTVMHLHIHLIPRYSGDTEDPRGGVRWIMPKNAPYWKKL